MADEQTVTVNLPKARVFRGRAYGPGRAVEVPVRVAKVWGLEGEAKASERAGAKKPEK